MNSKVVLTCEHAGNRVPAGYDYLFEGREEVLETHRGYDLGALELAEEIAGSLGASLIAHDVTRLLIDLNRSLGNPSVFSEFSKELSREQRHRIIRKYYEPHRRQVEKEVQESILQGVQVLHLAVHTFTPELNGVHRNADVGLLYDPQRKREKAFCKFWLTELARQDPELKIRMNYPYRGTTDGFTTWLRKRHDEFQYVGVELEVNQKHVRPAAGEWLKLKQTLASSLGASYQQLDMGSG